MYHKADIAFWRAALKDFPKLPHLTKVQIIYHYRTPNAFNTSCWSCFGSLLSNRDAFPRLEVVDVCPTFRSQRLGYHKMAPVREALMPLGSGRTLTFWGKPSETIFVPSWPCRSSPCFPKSRLVLLLSCPFGLMARWRPTSLLALKIFRDTFICFYPMILYMVVIHRPSQTVTAPTEFPPSLIARSHSFDGDLVGRVVLAAL